MNIRTVSGYCLCVGFSDCFTSPVEGHGFDPWRWYLEICSEVGTFAAQKQNNVNIQMPLSGLTIDSRTIQNSSRPTVLFYRTKSSY